MFSLQSGQSQRRTYKTQHGAELKSSKTYIQLLFFHESKPFIKLRLVSLLDYDTDPILNLFLSFIKFLNSGCEAKNL